MYNYRKAEKPTQNCSTCNSRDDDPEDCLRCTLQGFYRTVPCIPLRVSKKKVCDKWTFDLAADL